MKIKQIISAQPGWVALFKQDDGTMESSPVAIWAIVSFPDDPEGDALVGFSGGDSIEFTAPDSDAVNFEGYAYKEPK